MGPDNIYKGIPVHGVEGVLHVKGGIAKMGVSLEEGGDGVGKDLGAVRARYANLDRPGRPIGLEKGASIT